MGQEDLAYSRITQLRDRPIERLQQPLTAFMHIESASGVVLLICTAVALIAANSPYAEAYQAFWNRELRIAVGEIELAYPLYYWINEALMAGFFFVIGLEIKRELVIGELSDRKKLALPVAAALGGVIAPIVIYLSFQYGETGERGWAVPMATDIAFVVGCLSLLGRHVPHGLGVPMLSLAIVDDLMAVLVIAIFYASSISATWLAGAFVGLVAVAALNRLGVRSVGIYSIAGVWVWLCTLKSGVHPTIAGVILGLMAPVQPWLGGESFLGFLRHTNDTLRRAETTVAEARQVLTDLSFASREAVAPLFRIETVLHPWVAFGIMPLFALSNAGVPIDLRGIGEPVAVAVAAGLFFGKPIGIFGASWLTVKLGWASRPEDVTGPILRGGGFPRGDRVHDGPLHRGARLVGRIAGLGQNRHHRGFVCERCHRDVNSVFPRKGLMRTLTFAAILGLVGVARAQPASVFYSYTSDAGRTVYVNRFSMVPPEKRSEARAVDLSQVSLNEDLAQDLADAVEDELRYLKDSDPCVKARKEERAGAWRHVWARHGPWLLSSLAAMILLIMSPWMIPRTPPGVWSRFLMVALPALAMTALVAISATRADTSLEAVAQLSKLCDANEKEASPQKQIVRLNEMHDYIDQLYEDQYEEIQRVTEIE